MPGGFYFGSVDSNLEFSTSFLVKSGVNFRVDGTYSIKAHYGETEAVSFFDYYETLQGIIEDIVTNTEEIPESKSQTTESSTDVVSKSSSPSEIDNKNNNSVSKTNDSKSNTDNGVIKTVSENTSSQKTNDSEIIKTKIIDEKNTNKINDKKEIKKQNNLSVEDIELGIMLNQINLECDSDILTDTISYYDGMGPALYRLCKFNSSLNFFNESLIKNPDDVEILVNKGSALGKLGYFSEAIKYYDQAIMIDPDFLPAKNNRQTLLQI